MQNFMKTIISAVQTWTKGKIKDSTADWNQNDSSADNYVKNRTHWDSRKTEKINITFDGTLDGKEYLDPDGNGSFYLVKVSDLTPSIEEVTGGAFSAVENGEVVETLEITDGLILIESDTLYSISNGGISIALEDTGMGNGLVFTKGTWFFMEITPEEYFYYSDLSYTKEIGELKKLDSKYLDIPESIATTDDVKSVLDVVNEARSIADTAMTNAATAQTTADSKMNTANPVGSGSFSMNRKSGTTVGGNSHTEGYNTTASKLYSHAEGDQTTASGQSSHAEGYCTTASGHMSHAEGDRTTASGDTSHAEGYRTSTDNIEPTVYSLAFGYQHNGWYAHAEGGGTVARGAMSHAEGHGTKAYGYVSHSEGLGARASSDFQHVQGKYNTEDSEDKYTHIVGNGTADDARSNAHTIDWNGVGWFQGGLQVGGNAQDDGAKNVLLEGDAIPVPSTATVGQTVAVKTVDENGKPTEWEVVDMASADLTGYATEDWVDANYQPKGEYLTEHQDISGKLDASELPTAINTALAQAKESGEFDGEDGVDGYTPVKGVDYFDGNDGLPGYTPVKGVDYYTEAEQAEWEAYIATELAKRGQIKPEYANNIEECTDTTKLYVLPDGYIYAYIYRENSGPAYTNLADPTSADWLTNKRFSTSSISDFTGAYITNYIPCKPGDTIRMKGVDLETAINSTPRTRMYLDGQSVGIADYYVKSLITAGYGSFDSVTGITTFQLLNVSQTDGSADGSEITDYTFNSIRQNFRLLSGYTVNNVIITVNEEIAEGSVSGYRWANTGHAFVPADYEDRIVDLEKDVADNTSRINVLETSADMGASVPTYWAAHLQEKAEAIQLAMETSGRNKSAFLWYTDAHWANGNSKMSPALLNYLYRNTAMNKVNFGGDVVGDPAENTHDAISYVYEWRRMIKDLPNHHSVIGNHDNFHKGSADSEYQSMVYSFLLAPEETDNMVGDGLFYYYIDSPREKTRYLYLDSGRYSLSDEETTFIINALKDTPAGWHIVVFSHIWFQYENASTPTTGTVNAYMQKALNLFDAYNGRQSGSITMVSTAQSYDFTNCGGKVEFCMGGHIHVDHELYSTEGIPVILTASDVNQERSSDETEDSGAIGTITESAVFGIIADYNTNKITVVGVGRGTDRVISY